MKLCIFIIISLIFHTNSLYCQTSDIIVQAPIGSSVFLENQYFGKITPDDSEVVIHNIDEGDHTIKITKEGFKTHFGSVRIKDHSVVRYKGPVDLLLESENEDYLDSSVEINTGVLSIEFSPRESSFALPGIIGRSTSEATSRDSGSLTRVIWVAENVAVGKYHGYFMGIGYSMECGFIVEASDTLSLRMLPKEKGVVDLSSQTALCLDSVFAERGTFIDIIDNQEYGWERIGDQIWMTENLNYETPPGNRILYLQEGYYMNYGRLYDWHTANKVCPAGWHLPSDREWQRMERFLGMASPEDVGDRGGYDYVGFKLQSNLSEVYTVDRSDFNAQFGGEYNSQTYIPPGDKGSWWTSTLKESGYAWTRGLTRMKPGSGSNGSGVERVGKDVRSYRSVRCIKD